VKNVILEKSPDREIKMANAEGLKECRKLLTMAKAGKYNGYLLEGMACPGGWVAGQTQVPLQESLPQSPSFFSFSLLSPPCCSF